VLEHLTLRAQPVVDRLRAELDAFLLSRQAMRCTGKTLDMYEYALGGFLDWLQGQGVQDVNALTAGHIRAFLVHLEKRGLRDTTIHQHARAIRAWCNWLVAEGSLSLSPMKRVAMPRLEKRIPAPFTADDVRKLLAACDRKTAIGARDFALLLTLLDSGLRLAECASLEAGDFDAQTGTALIMGKGRKARQCVIGAKARAAILRMLAHRPGVKNGDSLWAAYDGQGQVKGALTAHGIQVTLRRLGARANVIPCGPHRFRRTFCLWMLRSGCDLEHLRLLMGHSGYTVLWRYLALTGDDLARAHREHSPVDVLLR